MTHASKPQTVCILAALAFAAFATAPAAFAAPAQVPHAKRMAAAKTVYVCNDCHAYYTLAMAKKLHYKDDMGHALVKSGKVPTGY